MRTSKLLIAALSMAAMFASTPVGLAQQGQTSATSCADLIGQYKISPSTELRARIGRECTNSGEYTPTSPSGQDGGGARPAGFASPAGLPGSAPSFTENGAGGAMPAGVSTTDPCAGLHERLEALIAMRDSAIQIEPLRARYATKIAELERQLRVCEARASQGVGATPARVDGTRSGTRSPVTCATAVQGMRTLDVIPGMSRTALARLQARCGRASGLQQRSTTRTVTPPMLNR